MAVLDLPGPPLTLCKEPLSACQAFSSSPMNGLLRAVSQGLFSFWTSKQGPEYRPDRAAIQGLRRETRPSLTPFCEVLPSGFGAAEKMCGLCPSPERIKSGSWQPQRMVSSFPSHIPPFAVLLSSVVLSVIPLLLTGFQLSPLNLGNPARSCPTPISKGVEVREFSLAEQRWPLTTQEHFTVGGRTGRGRAVEEAADSLS